MARAPRGRPLLILVIDDDPDLREVLQRQLEALGVRVVVAADGSEGLAQLEYWHPDVVFCDIAMPIMDGVEFATRMRGDVRFCRVPLIAVTGLSGETPLMATWRAGFDAHVDKPVAAATLASITQRFGGRLSGRSHERRSA